MSEQEETVDAAKDQNEEKEEEVSAPNPEGQPSADQEPLQEVHFDEKVNEPEVGGATEAPADATTESQSRGDADDNATVEDETRADVDKKSLKEDDEAPAVFVSVSVANVATKESEEVIEKTRSITSAMSYDTLTSATEVETKARTLGSIISIHRGSAAGGEYYDRHRIPKYMNSYKLEPDKPFHVERVEKFMREILSEALENGAYDADKTPKQAKWASSAIRAKLKEQEYDRCKFICIVTMGEKRSQDVQSIIRFLWDPDRDKFAHVVLENMTVFAVAVCFGIYYE